MVFKHICSMYNKKSVCILQKHPGDVIKWLPKESSQTTLERVFYNIHAHTHIVYKVLQKYSSSNTKYCYDTKRFAQQHS